ncbi:iron-sulfur cluster biosynthesis protein [Enterococcus sp. MJM12]|uniref:Iron-sulfur cluster biosynthesis protein n=1 Tax=Candidatus Enterococcus myersii TaxID=2815322 RepID=A0ABS3HAI3_9ENTE|nr:MULTISPECIES: iron-sulfur cluster biosynthesis protein [Enterococcus]MBO0450459.1 iron-sulfur cluster biosynthesis protein [Enterococcus sp. MJM12]MCD1023584.1 iron-sulfur cluster biosynthesis protein [Enterococcus sp. SMC-9]MDT2738581.1 iron-sulfur cluster biosynthesis protein [Enterococcus canintestini]WHA08343.1 iron-sulfur cluster biosynthesis protein [Enterococcus montenegrensis]
MKITITPAAAKWFKTELTVDEGMGVRFYGKVYGKTQVHEGFSVGMSVDTPENPIAKATADGILFYADEADEWFFKGYDLTVDLDEKLNEPKYLFTED